MSVGNLYELQKNVVSSVKLIGESSNFETTDWSEKCLFPIYHGFRDDYGLRMRNCDTFGTSLTSVKIVRIITNLDCTPGMSTLILP